MNRDRLTVRIRDYALGKIRLEGRSYSSDIRLSLALFAIVACYTIALGVLAERNSYFIADDYTHFYLSRDHSLKDYLFIPIDVHIVPLHRFFTYLIYQIFPLNYWISILLLLMVHSLTLYFLFKTLDLLGPHPSNFILLLLYSTNVYLIVPLIWWSSGIHRFPYVLSSVVCTYFYLQYRETRRPGRLFGALTAFMLGFGFYSKAALIPVYLLGLEICLTDRDGWHKSIANSLGLLPFFLVSLVYFILYRFHVPDHYWPSGPNLSLLVACLKQTLPTLAEGILSIVYDSRNVIIRAASLFVWMCFLAYTVIRCRRNARVWAVGIFLIVLNFLAIAVTSRVLWLAVGSVHRYYYESMFLVVIFLKLILRNVFTETGRMPSWAPSGKRLPVRLFGTVILAVYAMYAFHASEHLLHRHYAYHRKTKEYMGNLMTGIAELKKDPPEDLSFVDGKIPEYALGFQYDMAPYSKFFEVFDLQAGYGVPSKNLYEVGINGKLRRIEPDLSRGALNP